MGLFCDKTRDILGIMFDERDEMKIAGKNNKGITIPDVFPKIAMASEEVSPDICKHFGISKALQEKDRELII